jgi:hypothetical protein
MWQFLRSDPGRRFCPSAFFGVSSVVTMSAPSTQGQPTQVPGMNLPESFRRYGTAVLAGNPEIVHEWSMASGGCSLSIPAPFSAGFDVRFEIEVHAVKLYWGNWHTRFEPAENINGLIEDLFGLLRDMLSPDMRVREVWAGAKPYRGFLESFDGARWSTEHEMGLIFWNYLGRRSVRTYSNSILPGRLYRASQDAARD